MNAEKIINIEKVRAIIAEVLEVEIDEVKAETDLVEELDADSMMALEIMATIEKEFRVKIPENEIQNFTTLDAIIKIVEKEMR
ncbi:acyl carrier protein [Sporosarcina limicola]|uniref:Acyl carrier protein n=1 Tax=Sporosarcina limicola TaxID=34101 RepID=A0A927MI59_9BACL|nr:acyl carrier protein [Sporosarcina limicola]MBE1555095.1 acyl carrier protein [Sporosarcina limicola]